MTRDDYMTTLVDRLCEAAGLPKHTADLVRHVAEMSYSEGELTGRQSGLADAQKLMEELA